MNTESIEFLHIEYFRLLQWR